MNLEDPAAIQTVPFDFCIIGSGAMGIALATEMARAGRNVLMVEAGSDLVTAESQDFYRYASCGRDHGRGENRFRVYGGSTERWGGQAFHFDEADFAPRPWMGSTGWPVSHAEIAGYYGDAEKFMGLADPPYEELAARFYGAARRLKMDVPALKLALSAFRLHNSVFSKTPRLRELHRAALETDGRLHVLKHTAAIRLETDGFGTVKRLHLRTGGAEHAISARHFVLATGGIENARFLLLQRDVFRVPELQGHAMIGRCFQDHPGAHLAEVYGRVAALAQSVFRLVRQSGMDIKGRISWSEDTRMRRQRMAVSGTFLISRLPSPHDAAPPRADWFGKCLLAMACLARGVMYSPFHHTVLAVSAEDVRQPESHVALSGDAVDAFGLPRAVIHWKVAPQVADSIVSYVGELEKVIHGRQLGRLRRFPCAMSAGHLLPALADNAHHIGSTSMGMDVSQGVVDASHNVFGFRNLKVIGTSVLPTGSHANPTLTALALCFRLAGQRKART